MVVVVVVIVIGAVDEKREKKIRFRFWLLLWFPFCLEDVVVT